MYRLITHFLIALGFVLATSMTGYARMAPMPIIQSAQTAAICLDHGCNEHHKPDHSHHSPMASCIAAPCAGVVALPMSRAATVRIIDTAMMYHPQVLSSLIGVLPIPDAPPPRTLSLI